MSGVLKLTGSNVTCLTYERKLSLTFSFIGQEVDAIPALISASGKDIPNPKGLVPSVLQTS
jgi:hypothetical protein